MNEWKWKYRMRENSNLELIAGLWLPHHKVPSNDRYNWKSFISGESQTNPTHYQELPDDPKE